MARDSSINTILAKGTESGVKLYQIDLPGFYLQSEPQDATFDHEKPHSRHIITAEAGLLSKVTAYQAIYRATRYRA